MKGHLVMALGTGGASVLRALGLEPGREVKTTDRAFPHARFMLLDAHPVMPEELLHSYGGGIWQGMDPAAVRGVLANPESFPAIRNWLGPSQSLLRFFDETYRPGNGVANRHFGRILFNLYRAQELHSRLVEHARNLRLTTRDLHLHMVAEAGDVAGSSFLLDAIRQSELSLAGQIGDSTIHLLLGAPTCAEDRHQEWRASAHATILELGQAAKNLPNHHTLIFGSPDEKDNAAVSAASALWLERCLLNHRDFLRWTEKVFQEPSQRNRATQVATRHLGRREADLARIRKHVLLGLAARRLARGPSVPGLEGPIPPALPDFTKLLFPTLESAGKFPDPRVEWRRQSLGLSQVIQRCYIPDAWPKVIHKGLEEHFQNGFRGTGVEGWFRRVSTHAKEIAAPSLALWREFLQSQLMAGNAVEAIISILRQNADEYRQKARLLLEVSLPTWDQSETFSLSRNGGLISFALGTRERELETACLNLATEYYERTREAGGRAIGRILECLAEGIDEMALKLDVGLERFIEADTLCHRCAGLVAVKTGLAPRGTAEIPEVGAEVPFLFSPLSRAFWGTVACDKPFRVAHLVQTLEENLALIEAHARRESPRAENIRDTRADEAEWKTVMENLTPGSAYAEMKDDPLAEAISRHPPEGKSLALSTPPNGYTEGLLFHLASENADKEMILMKVSKNAHASFCRQNPLNQVLIHTEAEFTRAAPLS